MRVLVTGGAGFIGSHLTERLIKEGHQVMILDDFSTGSEDFVPDDVLIERIDIHDWKKVETAFGRFKPEAVFHLAAQIDIRSAFPDAKRYATDSMNILQWSKKYGVERFIFSSSAAVYGNNQNLPVSENEPAVPASAYGRSKQNFEQHLLSEHLQEGMKAVVLRYANVYGPRQGSVGEGGVVAVFCKALAKGASLGINGSGEQTRDFIFVEDVVELNVLALKSEKRQAVYNVSTGIETSINKLAEMLIALSGKRVGVAHGAEVAGEVERSALDNRLVQQELGWEPKVALREGLEKTWKWFEKNI
ncbi:MAG: NAD-dependent epimerase/dehydratase family protein [Candidatus Sungbacteria bacterium]|nr:NAD-dependent epimerase/dehydratase family protein [Candidatus Sungbacteria bacterium]